MLSTDDGTHEYCSKKKGKTKYSFFFRFKKTMSKKNKISTGDIVIFTTQKDNDLPSTREGIVSSVYNDGKTLYINDGTQNNADLLMYTEVHEKDIIEKVRPNFCVNQTVVNFFTSDKSLLQGEIYGVYSYGRNEKMYTTGSQTIPAQNYFKKFDIKKNVCYWYNIRTTDGRRFIIPEKNIVKIIPQYKINQSVVYRTIFDDPNSKYKDVLIENATVKGFTEKHFKDNQALFNKLNLEHNRDIFYTVHTGGNNYFGGKTHKNVHHELLQKNNNFNMKEINSGYYKSNEPEIFGQISMFQKENGEFIDVNTTQKVKINIDNIITGNIPGEGLNLFGDYKMFIHGPKEQQSDNFSISGEKCLIDYDGKKIYVDVDKVNNVFSALYLQNKNVFNVYMVSNENVVDYQYIEHIIIPVPPSDIMLLQNYLNRNLRGTKDIEIFLNTLFYVVSRKDVENLISNQKKYSYRIYKIRTGKYFCQSFVNFLLIIKGRQGGINNADIGIIGHDISELVKIHKSDKKKKHMIPKEEIYFIIEDEKGMNICYF